ncbi:MAG: zf-HC2 domain-containing protein [Deltaproteobacteria bacterium]|nr:zf-HC2 domain-containing protein [Deltaproteobacteria bacterium]
MHTDPFGHSLGTLLTGYVDGELPAALSRAVSGHLRECDSCGAEVASLIRLKSALRAVRSPPPSATAQARLVERLRAARLGR